MRQDFKYECFIVFSVSADTVVDLNLIKKDENQQQFCYRYEKYFYLRCATDWVTTILLCFQPLIITLRSGVNILRYLKATQPIALYCSCKSKTGT